MPSRRPWSRLAVVLVVLVAACEGGSSGGDPGRQGSWSPDPDLHDPVAPANPLPEPPLDPDGTLRTIWEYRTPNELDFHGVTDEAGNLYWIEHTAAGASEVVSVDWDGRERWRAPIEGKLQRRDTAWGADPDRLLLFAGGHVLVTLAAQDGPTCAEDVHLLALRAGNGTVAWRRTLGADLPPAPAFYLSCMVRTRQPAATDGAFVAAVTRCTRMDDCTVALEGFEVESGARRFSRVLTGATAGSSPVVDEHGNVFVTGWSEGPARFLSVAPSGAVRSDREVQYGLKHHSLGAVASGVLVHWAYARWSMMDASTLEDLLPQRLETLTWVGPPFRISGAALFATPQAPTGEMADGAYARLPLGSMVWDWAVWLPPFGRVATGTREMLLTSAGTFVFTRCAWDVCSLHEMDVDGYEHHRVPLPLGFGSTPPSLHHGRWVTSRRNLAYAGEWAVRSFDLPGRLMATKGWLTEHGSLAGDRRAR